MATTVQIFLNSNNGDPVYDFTLATFSGLFYSATSTNTPLYKSGYVQYSADTQGYVTLTTPLEGGKDHTFSFYFYQLQLDLNNQYVPVIDTKAQVLATFIFRDSQGNVVGTSPNIPVPFYPSVTGSYFLTDNILITIACLHGDSIVQSKEGPQKIKNTKINDLILTGENKFARVLKLAQCWIQMTKEPVSHDAIIFEPNSLSEGEPSERLIIDPGHPISTKADFEKHGIDALKKAGEFIGKKSLDLIYIRKWDDLIIQTNPEKQSIRYDLVLEEPHQTYIANGVVVKARKSVQNPGYLHRYDDFV